MKVTLYYNENIGIKITRTCDFEFGREKIEYHLELYPQFGEVDKPVVDIRLERMDCILLGHSLVGLGESDK